MRASRHHLKFLITVSNNVNRRDVTTITRAHALYCREGCTFHYSWCVTVVGHEEHKSVGVSVDSRPLYSWCVTVVGHEEHKSVGVSVDSRPLYSWCVTVVGHEEHKSVGVSVDSRPLYSWCVTVVDMMNTSQWECQLTAVLSTVGVLQLWT